MIATLQAYLSENRSRQLDELIDWLRIPSVSTEAAHKADMLAAANWLVENMNASGLENVELIHVDLPENKEGHPLVYGDWLHAGADKPTVLIYGHYDVQPVDPLDLWKTPPFEPTVRDDNLYARGASDDKGQTLIHIKSVEALLKATGELPVNVKFIIEGEEEAGGNALAAYIPKNLEKLSADICLISDTGMLSPDQPLIINGLRGGWGCEITVTGPTSDLHSGIYGGAVHNANQALAEILATLHDADGRVTVPGFYDRVAELTDEERAEMAKMPYTEADLKAATGIPAAYGEPDYTPVERTGARPTLEICGMWGGYIGDGAKTVIPSQAHAKLSCRLVPNQDPIRIAQLVKSHLHSLTPKSVKLEIKAPGDGVKAFVAPIDLPEMKAASRAYAKVFGAEPLFTRMGGGIPVTVDISEHLNMPIVLMGFGLPDDNLHAPNEKFHVPLFYKGIETSIAFMQELSLL